MADHDKMGSISIVIPVYRGAGTIGPLSPSVGWQGQHYSVAATAEEAACPPQALDTLNLVCDHFALTVAVDPSYWQTNTGSAVVDIAWADSSNDFDLYIFDKDGNEVDSSTQGGTTSERASIPQPSGTYDVVVTVNSGGLKSEPSLPSP